MSGQGGGGGGGSGGGGGNVSVASGGADFNHQARIDDKPPAPNFVRTPGGGWAPLATPETPSMMIIYVN